MRGGGAHPVRAEPVERCRDQEMAERFHTIRAAGIEVVIDLAVGHLRSVTIEREGCALTPLYTAPWVDDPTIAADESILPNLRFLSGDFFCAPFGATDDPAIPSHGWPANSRWEHVGTVTHEQGGSVARYALQKKILGARLVKEITLRDGHPFLYVRHVFEGGSGSISVASHAMTKFTSRGRLSFSPKAYGATPPRPQESDPARGRSALAYPARFESLASVPLKDGGTTDLHSYPIAERHEDFLILVEEEGRNLGWAAAVREDAADIVLSLKNPKDFPITMLWFSNGGRDYPPWNGRNIGVLGIEEGRAWSANGYKASIAPNPLSDSGVPTSLRLQPDGEAEVRHVIGAIPLPAGWTEVARINVDGESLKLRDVGGSTTTIPFASGFLVDWHAAAIRILGLRQVAEFEHLPRTDFRRNPETRAAFISQQLDKAVAEARQHGGEFDQTEFRRTLEDALDRPLQTEFEDPFFSLTADRMSGEILSVMKSKGLALRRKPVVGTLRLGRFNAVAMDIQNPEYVLILMENGLFSFVHQFSNFITESLEPFAHAGGVHMRFGSPRALAEKLAANPVLVHRFVLLFAALLGKGDIFLTEAIRTPPDRRLFIDNLTAAMELFVLAHEYGHCSLGHLDVGPAKRLAPIADGVEPIAPLKADEFEADTFGMRVAIMAMNERSCDYVYSYGAIEAFFAGLGVAERVKGLLAGETSRSLVPDTHPTADERIAALRRTLRAIVTPEQAKPAEEHADLLRATVETYWRFAEPVFRDLGVKEIPISA